LDLSIAINLFLVALLIVMTAFFVGAEFAAVKVRVSRLDQLIAEGNKQAVAAKKLVSDLDYYLSACQLGITVTALGLGTLGEPTVEKILHPLFNELSIPAAWSTFISYALALSIMTFLHVVLGELAPKTLAIQYSERMTLLLARPLVGFGKLLFPFIYILNGAARLFLRMFGVKPAGHEQAHSEEELKIIMTQSYQSGEINQTELSYVQNIFAFDERIAKDIMVPRTQMITIDQSMDRQHILQLIDEYRYTRYPVTRDGSKDDIIGSLNAKEMVTHLAMGREPSIKDHLHAIHIIHEATPLKDVLLKMQRERVHMALVIDEYGGTAGIITMEDILEEIVGDIRDEFDEDEQPDIVELGEKEYLINGRVLLEELEARFGLKFGTDLEVDTIGGWIQVQTMTQGTKSKDFRHDGHCWILAEVENRQILRVRLKLDAYPAHEDQETGV